MVCFLSHLSLCSILNAPAMSSKKSRSVEEMSAGYFMLCVRLPSLAPPLTCHLSHLLCSPWLPRVAHLESSPHRPAPPGCARSLPEHLVRHVPRVRGRRQQVHSRHDAIRTARHHREQHEDIPDGVRLRRSVRRTARAGSALPCGEPGSDAISPRGVSHRFISGPLPSRCVFLLLLSFLPGLHQIPFIFTSTSLVLEADAYGTTKRVGESWVKAMKLGKIVRLWNAYGQRTGERARCRFCFSRTHRCPICVSSTSADAISLACFSCLPSRLVSSTRARAGSEPIGEKSHVIADWAYQCVKNKRFNGLTSGEEERSVSGHR